MKWAWFNAEGVVFWGRAWSAAGAASRDAPVSRDGGGEPGRRDRSERPSRIPMRGPLVAAAGGAMGGPGGPLARAIRDKLTAALQPTHLEVRDDSPRHGGPPGAETHFGVLVVSGRFAGLAPLQRHRLVHEALRDELAGPLHALQIVARTPEQWQSDPRAPPAPPCMGGSKRERRKGEEGAEGAAGQQ